MRNVPPGEFTKPRPTCTAAPAPLRSEREGRREGQTIDDDKVSLSATKEGRKGGREEARPSVRESAVEEEEETRKEEAAFEGGIYFKARFAALQKEERRKRDKRSAR